MTAAAPTKTSPADLDRAALIIQLVCRHFRCSCAQIENDDPQGRELARITTRLLRTHTFMSMSVIAALLNRTLPQMYSMVYTRDPDFLRIFQRDLDLLDSQYITAAKHLSQ